MCVTCVCVCVCVREKRRGDGWRHQAVSVCVCVKFERGRERVGFQISTTKLYTETKQGVESDDDSWTWIVKKCSWSYWRSNHPDQFKSKSAKSCVIFLNDHVYNNGQKGVCDVLEEVIILINSRQTRQIVNCTKSWFRRKKTIQWWKTEWIGREEWTHQWRPVSWSSLQGNLTDSIRLVKQTTPRTFLDTIKPSDPLRLVKPTTLRNFTGESRRLPMIIQE